MVSARVVLLLLAVLLAGCAHRLEDLEPYPCPTADAFCPDGRVCVPRVGCVTPSLDGPCNDYTDCSLAAPDAVCVGGRCANGTCQVGACERHCDPQMPCGVDRVCLPIAGQTATCVPDCITDGVCPAGMTCRAVSDSGPYACIPTGVEPARCASVQAFSLCSQCGDASGFDVGCPGSDVVCAHLSSCAAGTSTCTCNPGLVAFSCNEVPCSSTSCDFPSWYCRPADAPVSPGCTDSLFRVSGLCACMDGRTLSFECGRRGSCEQMCSE